MAVYESVTALIGNTPLLKLKNFCSYANIFAKLEFLNPAGSVKDRTALAMLDDAEARGILKKGATIIEPTSGNTGIGLAAIGAARGYGIIIIMPEGMSAERQSLIKAYGAEVILTEGKKGMTGAIERAERLKAQIAGSVILGQFINPANPAAHANTTGPEIWEDLCGNVDIFVAGVGTGGTLTGAGGYLKSRNPGLKVVAVEPYDSPVLSGGCAGAHGLQGIGAGFVPEILDTKLYGEVITVRTEEAYSACRKLAKSEGVLVGVSSGAALFAATQIAERKENAGKNTVVILPDGGERYLSVPPYKI